VQTFGCVSTAQGSDNGTILIGRYSEHGPIFCALAFVELSIAVGTALGRDRRQVFNTVRLNRLLPATEIFSLRCAVVISCIAFGAQAVLLVDAFLDQGSFAQPVFSALLLLEVFFLWRLSLRARIIAMWIWGIHIVSLVLGCLLNPFFWMDFQPDSKWEALTVPLTALVVCVIGIWCFHVLRTYTQSSA
jgi:hypothetical protein